MTTLPLELADRMYQSPVARIGNCLLAVEEKSGPRESAHTKEPACRALAWEPAAKEKLPRAQLRMPPGTVAPQPALVLRIPPAIVHPSDAARIMFCWPP